MLNSIEKERKFWNAFSGRYDAFIRITLGHIYRELYKKLKEDVAGSDHILEIATGTGLLSFEICNYVKHIDAIDISPEMIQFARKKKEAQGIENIDFETGDCCNLKFNENTFDLVIASNVLHLLPDPQKALSEMLRVLKIDGKVIIPTFCHGENFKSRLLSRLMQFSGFRARNIWSKQNFEKFVEHNGFRILKSEKIEGKIPLTFLVAQKLPDIENGIQDKIDTIWSGSKK